MKKKRNLLVGPISLPAAQLGTPRAPTAGVHGAAPCSRAAVLHAGPTVSPIPSLWSERWGGTETEIAVIFSPNLPGPRLRLAYQLRADRCALDIKLFFPSPMTIPSYTTVRHWSTSREKNSAAAGSIRGVLATGQGS